MNIRWLKEAINDLEVLRKYIAKENTIAANRVAARILQAVAYLTEQPGMGKPGRVPHTRELIVADIPCVVPYRVKGGSVEVLTVLFLS